MIEHQSFLEKMKKRYEATIARTPNFKCPACLDVRLHTGAEWAEFHPDAGSGQRDNEKPKKKPAEAEQDAQIQTGSAPGE
jgi:hypothetical protein